MNKQPPKVWPLLDKETVLEDSYPVFCDYAYIVDGKICRSNVEGTVFDLKRDMKATEVRRCELIVRGEAGCRFGDLVEISEQKKEPEAVTSKV